MKKFNFFISAILSVMFILGVMSCNNLIPINPNKNNETESGFGEISAKVFVPDYSKMAGESRIVAPQSATINLRYKTDWNNEWQDLGSLDIDMSALESVDDSYDLPGGIWKGVFEDIPSGTYGPGKFKVRLLDDTGNVITTGINSVEVVIKAEEITENVVFYQTPVNSSNNTGTLAEGKMLFWMFTMEKGYDYTLTVNAEGTYPDIVLFDSDGTYKEYHSIDSAEKAKVPVSKVTEKTVYYVGVYADDGDVTSYSISFGYTDENGNVVSGGLEAAPNAISFDLSGAQALATFENSSSRSARAITDNEDMGILAKVLADGSMKSVIVNDSGIELPSIKYIMQSPSSRNNQLYIVFPNDIYESSYWEYTFYDEDGKIIGINKNYEWPEGATNYSEKWKQGERIIGSLVCVYDDGSYVDVLASDAETSRSLIELANPLVFDDNGYMYYISREWINDDWSNETKIIYRFNPNTKLSEQLTVGMPGYSYSKIQVSKDGQWVFVQGYSNSGSFIRAIPVANPNGVVNLLFSSDGFMIGDWFYDDESDAVYVASDVGKKYGLMKFVKNSSGNFANDSYSIYNNRGIEDESKYIYNNMRNYTYKWNSEYLDSYGLVDASKVIQKIIDSVNDAMPKTNWYYYNFYKIEYTNSGEEKILVGEKIKLDTDWPYGSYTDKDWDYYEIYYWNKDYTESKCLPSSNETYIYSSRSELNDGYKLITKDDVDIRFDNTEIGEFYMSGNLDPKRFISDMKGKKNEVAISTFDSLNLEMLSYNMNITFGNTLYLKGTDTLLCNDESYKECEWQYYDYYKFINIVNTPRWNDEYYDRYGNLDYKKILDYFFSFKKGNIGELEFRLDRFNASDNMDIFYSTKTGEDAVEFICSSEERMKKIRDTDIEYFVAKTCFVKETGVSILPGLEISNAYYPWWYSVRMLVKTNNQLWGVEDNNIICLLDENDKYVGRISSEFEGLKIYDIARCEKGFYFRNKFVDSDGSETGYQDVRMYDVSSDKVINLFQKLANKDNLTVESVTMAGNSLYVCTTNGLTIANYCIDMNTLKPDILAVTQRFKDIIGFSMPTATEITGYAISKRKIEHTSIDIDMNRAEEGETVLFSVTADEGYDISSVTVDGVIIEGTDGVYSFEMPPNNVQISATVSPKRYFITLAENLENIIIKLDAENALPGDTVRFTVTAAEGYCVQSVKADNEQFMVTNGDYSFEMPANNVEVSAEAVKDCGDLDIIIY